jgi:hypothetical protein
MRSIRPIVTIAGLSLAAAVTADAQHHDHTARARLSPPASIRIEHEAIHA